MCIVAIIEWCQIYSEKLVYCLNYLYNISDLPKGLLDASDVIFAPVSLGDVFLTDRDTLPGDTHDGDVVDVVLIKLNVEL